MTERETLFLENLRGRLRERHVSASEAAGWLGLNVGNVSRRLTGKTPFRREELATLDTALGEDGSLLWAAGYVPDGAEAPRGRLLDEAWLAERLEEKEALLATYELRPAVVRRRINELLNYLAQLPRDRRVRRYQASLRLDLLDLVADSEGVDRRLIARAEALGQEVAELRDTTLSYDYAATLSDLYQGAGDYEAALVVERRSLALVDRLPKPTQQRLTTELSIAHLLTFCDPENAAIDATLDSASAVLSVPSYAIGQWPQRDEPDYLDLLQAKMNVYLARGDTYEAERVLGEILANFLHCPDLGRVVSTLLSAAELYAVEAAEVQMETYLRQATALMKRWSLHWFQGEDARIRAIYRGR